MIKTLLATLLLTFSAQCPTPTFHGNLLEVNRASTFNISDCISPDVLTDVIFKISARNQNIQDLNDGAVQNLLNLSFIDFSNNSIEIVREGAFFNLPTLSKVYLADNEISWLTENVFKDLPMLTSVLLRNNKISDLSRGAFSNLPLLARVNLDGNRLENFNQAWFYKTPALTVLELSYNYLRRIPRGAFINLPSITYLRVAGNQIEFIDKDAFMGLRDIDTVNLSGNRMKSFEINFHVPSKLVQVFIDNNNVTFISDMMLETMRPNLEVFGMDANPWQCECLDKIVNWSIAFDIQIHLRKHKRGSVVCVFPKKNSFQCLERNFDDFEEGFWLPCARGNRKSALYRNSMEKL
ncbi:carboxypeptidase N subunit 2-like [Photinus pyralis]|uniref:carboxypeptidase N subunit 2-like n=1 Tax=Photinus pyralis TaxID=7054 RepID=UPI00126704A6|nr:carboxypeptidase N subunit 2-like [Photinus pyralis]